MSMLILEQMHTVGKFNYGIVDLMAVLKVSRLKLAK